MQISYFVSLIYLNLIMGKTGERNANTCLDLLGGYAPYPFNKQKKQ